MIIADLQSFQRKISACSLAALGRRGFAAMWHPLAAQLGASPPLGRTRPPPAPHPASHPRSGGGLPPATPPAQQRPPLARSVSARARPDGPAGRAGGGHSGRTPPQRSLSAGVAAHACFSGMAASFTAAAPTVNLQPGSPAEALEQVLHSAARPDCPRHIAGPVAADLMG